MRKTSEFRRGLLFTIVAVTVAALGLAPPGHADEALPGSCKLHDVHVVNPGCVPALTSEVREPGLSFPNLSPDVRDMYVQRAATWDPATMTFVPGDLQLHFDSWVQNIGTTPLELMADDPNNPTTVLQCVAWTANRVCREKLVVGDYVWHEDHNHFHFADFANYQLRRLGADGRPDYSDAGLVSVAEKVSFCLVDASLIDLTKPAPPFYLTCGPHLQGVSPGWADVYSAGTPGQELSIEGLTDGRYALIVAMDYPNRLYETYDTDNVVEITVELSEGLTQAAIVDRHYP